MRLRGQPKDSAERRRDEATRWFVILQTPKLSSRTLKSWKRWEAVPKNRRMFDEMERLWGRLDELPSVQSSTSQQLAADRYDGSMAIAAWQEAIAERAAWLRKLHMWIASTGVAATIAVVAIGLGSDGRSRWASQIGFLNTQVFETTVAQHQEVLLEDGSKIQLDAKSAVSAKITKDERIVTLERGEALFKVARDPQRPFKVIAGGGVITAVGTAFNVRHLGEERIVVVVTEGTVEVTSKAELKRATEKGQDLSSLRLVRGQEITYDAAGQLSMPRLADEEIVGAWQDGRLQYRREPLRNVIPDVNRYSHREVVLENSAVGELLFSGTVFERDVDEWIVGLEKTYPELEVVDTGERRVIIRSRSSQ